MYNERAQSTGMCSRCKHCDPPFPQVSTPLSPSCLLQVLFSMSSSSSLRKFHSDGFPAQVACDLAPPPQEVMPHSPPWSLTADWLSSLCSEARQTAPAPSPEPPADPCPQPPSGLQGIASFSLAAAFSSFHVPGWLPGSAKAQTWLQGNRDRHSSFIT